MLCVATLSFIPTPIHIARASSERSTKNSPSTQRLGSLNIDLFDSRKTQLAHMERKMRFRKGLRTLVMLPILQLTLSATDCSADSEYVGVQYKCDSKNSLISFAAYDEGWYRVPVMRGYHVLRSGNHILRCLTKHGAIRSAVNVLPPGNGMCRGSGSVYIEDVTIGEKSLINRQGSGARQGADLNWACPFISDYFLSRLDVRVDVRSATTSRCIADARVDDPHELGCAEETVDR
jgi:hypothetical protein